MAEFLSCIYYKVAYLDSEEKHFTRFALICYNHKDEILKKISNFDPCQHKLYLFSYKKKIFTKT